MDEVNHIIEDSSAQGVEILRTGKASWASIYLSHLVRTCSEHENAGGFAPRNEKKIVEIWKI